MINEDTAPPGKKWDYVEKHYICPFHRTNPQTLNHAACTCSSSWAKVLVDDIVGELNKKGGSGKHPYRK